MARAVRDAQSGADAQGAQLVPNLDHPALRKGVPTGRPPPCNCLASIEFLEESGDPGCLARQLHLDGCWGSPPSGEPVDFGRVAMPLRSLLCLCALALPLGLQAGPATDEPVMLVAQSDLDSVIFESAVLLVKPLADGGHIGFIINRPTNAKMSDLFPEDEASKKIADPLYLGGPDGYNRVFAVVGQRDTAGKDALQLMPGVFLVSESKDIDKVIASDPEHARFFLGLVIWRPGQLDEELDRGYWFVDKADAKLVLEKKTDGLWEELVRRSEARAHST